MLRAFKHRVDPRRFNGATLIGLKGVVVKSHGSADALAFEYALRKAYTEAAHGVLDKIAQRMAAMAELDVDARRGRSDGGRCIAGSSGPAAICPRKSSPTTSSRSASTRAMRGSARAPASASAASPHPTEKTSDLAEHAARAALAAAGIAPADVDLIVVATTTPDMVFPSTACILQAKLGAVGGPAFDVQAVCSGFVYALAIADRMVASGMARNALVVGAEIYSRILDWNDRGSCVLFGDGAGAVVLVPSQAPGIGSAHLHADGRYRDILCVPGTLAEGAISGTPFVRMDGPAVFKFAVRVHGRGRRRGARGQRRRRRRPSTGSFRTRPTSASWKRPRRSWACRPSG